MHEPGVRLSLRALILLTLLGWLSMIGFDFFLHAGLLARLYLTPSPFLLPCHHHVPADSCGLSLLSRTGSDPGVVDDSSSD